jgi:hypothetical protein
MCPWRRPFSLIQYRHRLKPQFYSFESLK